MTEERVSKLADYITQVMAYAGLLYFWGAKYAFTAWVVVTLSRVIKNQ